MDASIALDKIIEHKKLYDLILIDVYGWDGEIPDYFNEKLFFEKTKQVLDTNWVVSINFADYNLENIEKSNRYKKIHENLIQQFWEFYSHILLWKNDRWNVMWIYNLDKFYEAYEYEKNYLDKVKTWEIMYDENIIKNTILE
jgi:spermidine synthase